MNGFCNEDYDNDPTEKNIGASSIFRRMYRYTKWMLRPIDPLLWRTLRVPCHGRVSVSTAVSVYPGYITFETIMCRYHHQ